jgi:ABC-2 type transport system permease protein
MARYLDGELGIALVRSEDMDYLDSELVEKRISGIISLPEGFEAALLAGVAGGAVVTGGGSSENAGSGSGVAGGSSGENAGSGAGVAGGSSAPAVLTFLNDYANEAFLRGYIDAYLGSLSTLAAASGDDAEAFGELLADAASGGVKVSEEAYSDSREKEQTGKDAFSAMIGFFMMFCFMMSIGVSSMLHEDRAAGTYRRIKAGKVNSVQYVASVAAVGFVLALLIEAPSLALYTLSNSDSGVPVGITALMLFAFTLFVIAFGMFVGIAASGMNGIVSVIIAVSCITSMLSGAWFPIALAPQPFQTLSYAAPQRWVFEVIASYQNGAGSVGLPLVIVLLASLLFFMLAGIKFASNRSTA